MDGEKLHVQLYLFEGAIRDRINDGQNYEDEKSITGRHVLSTLDIRD